MSLYKLQPIRVYQYNYLNKTKQTARMVKIAKKRCYMGAILCVLQLYVVCIGTGGIQTSYKTTKPNYFRYGILQSYRRWMSGYICVYNILNFTNIWRIHICIYVSIDLYMHRRTHIQLLTLNICERGAQHKPKSIFDNQIELCDTLKILNVCALKNISNRYYQDSYNISFLIMVLCMHICTICTCMEGK